jgi:hypothetical protein
MFSWGHYGWLFSWLLLWRNDGISVVINYHFSYFSVCLLLDGLTNLHYYAVMPCNISGIPQHLFVGAVKFFISMHLWLNGFMFQEHFEFFTRWSEHVTVHLCSSCGNRSPHYQAATWVLFNGQQWLGSLVNWLV